MSFEQISLFLDILVLVFLGVTIYVAVRLSKGLTAFRANRKEMGELIQRLSTNIDQANAAIINMRATVAKSSGQLKDLIQEARDLSSELQIMNEAANNTAKRLERASGVARTTTPRTAREPETPSRFAIQDREFEQPSTAPRDDDEDTPEHLQSQAERELYRALKKRPAGGGRH